MIQTFTPDNDVIRFSARQDYDSFYRTEIQLRRLRGYPPFADVFVLTASGADEGAVLRCCVRLRRALEEALAACPERLAAVGARPGGGGQGEQPLPLPPDPDGPERLHLRAPCWPSLLRAAQQDKENRGVRRYMRTWTPTDLNGYKERTIYGHP